MANIEDLEHYVLAGKMEANVRKMLIEKKMAKVEEVATMTCLDVCKRLLEYYVVIYCDLNKIRMVKLDDWDTYESLITVIKN